MTAAAVGHNRPDTTLPPDRGEATRVLFQRLVKMAADRKAYGDTARDMLRDARKQYEVKPSTVRLGFKLSKMSPEKREIWVQEASAAAVMFGYSPLEVADAKRDGHLWNLVQTLATIENERREIGEQIKELKAYANERGDLKVKEIVKCAALARKPKDELSDEWAELDTMGTFLGLW
jgi:uncharacterized protein (UPF0335 family)